MNVTWLFLCRRLADICVLIYFFCHFTSAVGATADPDPKDLIGLATNGPFYPSGWRQISSDGFGRSPYFLTTLRRSKAYVMLLERQVSKPKSGERIRAVVTDAIAVVNPTSYRRFSRICYLAGEEANKMRSNILAEVRFAKFCDMTTALVRRAWRINLQTGKFDPIQNTRGLTCEYGYVALGEPDSREGCPSYNWRSEK